MQISDSIKCVADGKVIDTVQKADTDEVKLARLMVGRDVFLKPAPKSKKIGEPILKAQNLSAVNDFHHPVLKDISFEVKSGEVLGIAGVDGNGQSELVRALIGLQPLTGGKIFLHDKESHIFQ